MSSIADVWLTPLFHLPLIVASWLLAGKLSGRAGAPRLVSAFLIGCGLWRAETLLLDRGGGLSWPTVLVLHLLLWLGVTLWVRRRPSAGDEERPTTRAHEGGPPPAVFRLSASLFAGGWIAVICGLACYRILLLPDPYDSLTYHLMLPARWLQTGSLDLVPTVFGHIAPSYTPEAVEGFFLGLMLPTGHDALARVGQLPFLFAGAYLVFDSVRSRTPNRAAWLPGLAASAYLLLPDLLVQGTGSMVDVAAATYFLATWHAREQWLSSRRSGWLWFGGTMAGLFLASRVPALLFTPLLILPWLPHWKRDYRCYVRFVVPLLLTGAYPYLRNWIFTGNPLYPLELVLGPIHLPGLFTREATRQAVFHLSGRELLEYYGLYLRGSGVLWCSLGILGTLVGGLAALRRRGEPRGETRNVPSSGGWEGVVGIGVTLILFYVIPFNANGRFLFPAWGLFIIGATGSLGPLRAGPLRLGQGVLLAAFAYLLVDALRITPLIRGVGLGRELLFSVGLVGTFGLGMSVAWLSSGLAPPARRGVHIVLCVIVLTTFGGLDPRRESQLDAIYERDHARRYATYGEGWRIVRSLPAPARIGYAGANLPYLLTGPRMRHEVTVVPLDGSPAGLLPHEHQRRLGDRFRPSPLTGELALDRLHPDQRAWRQRVLEERIDYLALYLRRGQEPIEYRWATRAPEQFEELNPGESGGRLKIFRVHGEPDGGG